MPEPVFMEEIISVTQVPNPVRCPKCGGGNLVLKGVLQREYEETWENGQEVGNKIGDGPLTHEVERIICSDCKICFVLQTRELYQLTQTNSELAGELSKLTGRGKPC
jgi:hypothetical protein